MAKARPACAAAAGLFLLAIAVSLSMRVADVTPSRLVAAQEAAKLFLRELARNIDVGLVTFAGSTQVAQQATLDRTSLVGAIDAFQMQRGTAIGNAIVLCLAELFPDHGSDLGDMTFGAQKLAPRAGEKEKAEPKQIDPVAPGSCDAAAIMLPSDGRRTMGTDTLAGRDRVVGALVRAFHLTGR